ncbi:HAMP domain-containing protein [Peribacillus acanthi]|uniref:HAMP domain-containing protein n=1 Tax=Peribacillus acanthi TaxID=2171554 RepID=UPI000D3E51D8|nr:methyl-accepting chemotaxis protein [Peribacillus acanthi]
MRMIKKKTVIGQTLSAIAMILIVVCSSFVLMFPKMVDKDIDHFLYEHVFNTAKIVKGAMDTSMNSKVTIERLIDEKLYLSSLEISKELEGKKIQEVSREDLVALKEKLGLYDISLFVKREGKIIVAQSSDPHELGLDTKDWSYWNEAFEDLMAGREVDVGKGYYRENFWSGPVSRSEWEDKYFKYAYFYDGSTDYMINPYILDKDLYESMKDSGPDSMIQNIVDSSELKEVSIINMNAMLKGRGNQVVEPDRDLPILHGRNTMGTQKDYEYIHKVQDSHESQSFKFVMDGKRYKKFYIPISHDKLITVVTDYSRHDALLEKLRMVLIFSFTMAFIIIFLVLRLVTRKHLEPLSTINALINEIATGDLTGRLHIDQHNEWGDISMQLNKMSDDFSLLVSQVKERIHSVMIVSSLIAETVNSFFKMMDQVSSSMTFDSRELFHDIDLQVEEIQRKYKEIADGLENPHSLKEQELIKLSDFIFECSAHMEYLNGIMKVNVNKVTEMSMSTNEAIDDLNNVIRQLDELSKDLEQKIQVFKVVDNHL